MQVQLDQVWMLGEQIGRGGFGKVYVATSSECDDAVAKLVPKYPGASRELLFADLHGVRNVIPIIDSGETDSDWVIIMPRARMSLRQRMDDKDNILNITDSVAVLIDLTTALSELDGKVVHRDLKPENVLLFDGNWCLADFGISRYAEATTAPDTQKFALSPPYAAPERWREERATGATDIYSLGVIAFELLSGSLPYQGSDKHEYREQHLHSDPPELGDGVPTLLRAAIGECLYKSPQARPSAENLLTRLKASQKAASSPGLTRLQSANSAEVERRAEEDRQGSKSKTETERRAALFVSAQSSMDQISTAMTEAITAAAPTASMQHFRSRGWTIRLGPATLTLSDMTNAPQNPWMRPEHPVFDVISYSELTLEIPPDRYSYNGRSHSLWYCDAKEAGRYNWFETAFMISPMIARESKVNPFALSPGEQSAKALWRGTAEYQTAWPFSLLTIGDLVEFIDRWANWFGDAASGELRRPRTMPERESEGTWRRE